MAILRVLAALVVTAAVAAVPAAGVTEGDVDRCIADCVGWLCEQQFKESDVGKELVLRDPGGTFQGSHYEVWFARPDGTPIGPAELRIRLESFDVGTWPATFRGDGRILYTFGTANVFQTTPKGVEPVTLPFSKYPAALIDRSNHRIYLPKPEKLESENYWMICWGGAPDYSIPRFIVPMLELAVEHGVRDKEFLKAVERALRFLLTVDVPRGYWFQVSPSGALDHLQRYGTVPGGYFNLLYSGLWPVLLGKRLGLVSEGLWKGIEGTVKELIRRVVLASQVTVDPNYAYYCYGFRDCRGWLVVDPVHGEARWVVEVRAGDGWVPLMTVNPTACAVLTLLEA
ncbi:MAG: hypothetical protein ABGY09_01325, partial [Euryarchaeota archaeon]